MGPLQAAGAPQPGAQAAGAPQPGAQAAGAHAFGAAQPTPAAGAQQLSAGAAQAAPSEYPVWRIDRAWMTVIRVAVAGAGRDAPSALRAPGSAVSRLLAMITIDHVVMVRASSEGLVRWGGIRAEVARYPSPPGISGRPSSIIVRLTRTLLRGPNRRHKPISRQTPPKLPDANVFHSLTSIRRGAHEG